MGGSNEEWGELADDDQRDAWDSFDPLPEAGVNQALDSFVASKNIAIPDLVRIGARLLSPSVLAFGFPGGLKYRNIVDGRRWSWVGSEWTALKIIPSVNGAVGAGTVVVCEGETDAAWLSGTYPVDVAVLPAGARTWKQSFTAQMQQYETVLVGTDNDEAGESGFLLIKESVPKARRLRPPASDWCAVDRAEAPELPGQERLEEVGPEEPNAAPRILVPAGELLQLEVPEQPSWLAGALLPVEGTMVLHGGFKSFKTWMALDLAGALAVGGAWAGYESAHEAARVAVIQYEVPWAYYRERIAQLREQSADTARFDANFLTYTPLTRPKLRIGRPDTEKKVIEELLDEGIDVVVIDPLRRAVLPGKSFNDEDGAPSFIRAFVEALQANHMTVVLVHHDNLSTERTGGQSDPSNMTGSGAWAGDPDTIATVSRPRGEDREGTRRNVHFLLRNAPSPAPRGFLLNELARVEWALEPYVEREDGEDY